ncbi:serine carboxypeptidase-like 17 isoform X2 [Quercus lobata]|uniref:serine carboxypeptidase-like 17 isoform X2 n=1 Tax=Quercus lobata TaxID=97700 RepID=UPI0012469F7E|nr:serine carboxypeptidase-like 17 isoform X2 [Quercus lobata]
MSPMWLYIVSFLAVANLVASQSIIKNLPGFSGDLPFKLETGYVGVGDLDEVQLFYYFIESERSPEDDPLVLWLNGGPGCSALSGLMYEIGPFTFDYANSKTYSPKLKLNPYSFTKVANIIFVDTPVGSGFSYAKTSEGYYISDTLAAAELYEFLRKWLKVHPKFLTNTLYVMGDSYSGIIIPILVQEISDGNEAGREPQMNLKGYVIGNPVTNTHVDLNERIPFAHLKALISDELYESTKKDCKGEYMIVDPSNAACVDDLKVYTECIEKIVTQHILEPTCQLLYPKPRPRVSKWDPDTPIEDSAYLLQSITHLPEPRRWCREYNYLYSYIWANDKTVQKALHVREGSINEWVRCNESLVYTYDVTSSLNYHRNLIKKGYEVLIYSGDHDMVIPYISTHAWIESLNLTIAHDWRPWFVDGQVAGFTMQYTFKKYCLTFATVKGGGHTAPEYKPNECLAMVDRWLSYYPL